MAAAKKSTKKAAPAPEPEELEEDLELDEVDEDEAEEATPSKKKSSVPEVTFGAADLAKHLTEKHGKTVTARELRTLIRKMARDGSKRVNREIVAGNRDRYNWSGLNDPEVKAIIKAYEGGELEADKKAKLEELKNRKAAQKAEKAKKQAADEKKKAKGKKAKPAPVEDDDEDLDLDDDDE